MIQSLRNLCRSIFYPSPRTRKNSLADAVVVVALSALALTSRVFDRTDPVLAFIMRCTAGGFGLYWLFSRCCVNRRPEHPPGGLDFNSVPLNNLPRPSSQPNYSQSSTLYSGPGHRLDRDPIPSFSSSITYSAATHRSNLGAHVVPASINITEHPVSLSSHQGSGIMYEAPQDHFHIDESFPPVAPSLAINRTSSSFNSRSVSSSSSSSMTPAPVSRSTNVRLPWNVNTSSSGNFPGVRRAETSSREGFGASSGTTSTSSLSSNERSFHSGNDRPMFTAAKER